MDTTEDDVEISDQERIFHGSVRENVVSFFYLYLVWAINSIKNKKSKYLNWVI